MDPGRVEDERGNPVSLFQLKDIAALEEDRNKNARRLMLLSPNRGDAETGVTPRFVRNHTLASPV
jgi:hypothetical protein